MEFIILVIACGIVGMLLVLIYNWVKIYRQQRKDTKEAEAFLKEAKDIINNPHKRRQRSTLTNKQKILGFLIMFAVVASYFMVIGARSGSGKRR